MKKSLKLTISVLVIVLLAMGTLTGFSVHKGFGKVYFESNYEIFQGANFGQLIGENSIHGIENACFVEADISEGILKPFVFAGEVRGAYTLEEMVESAEKNGYKVVAGINGDIFDTANGTPRGTVIHNGNIITSGYHANRVIVFDKNNKTSMATVGLKYSLTTKVDSGLYNTNIGYFNVPDGGAGSLFLYNRNYSASTRTSGQRVEVVITAPDWQMAVNKTITGNIKSVGTTSNTPIGDKELVLSASASCPYGDWLKKMQVGESIELSCTETASGLAQAQEAVGFYHSIVENGEMVTVGTAVNPRTAMGVKKDGTLVLYTVDGRQNDKSKGLNIEELAHHLISLGCVSAWNLDGGGSSQMVVRQPGIESKASLKNSPSGGSARKVSNGILLVYQGTGSSEASNLHIYPSDTILLPGESVSVKTYATNSNYEKVSLPKDISYSVDNFASINGSVYSAGQSPGESIITARGGDLTATSRVQIVDKINIQASTKKLRLKPGETKQISGTVFYGVYPLTNSKPNFIFTCDETIGTISSSGLFKAIGTRTEVKGKINISYGDNSTSIQVEVTPSILKPVMFSDTYGHWAKDYIGVLAAMDKVGGIGNNMYNPEGPLTRAQFLAFLAKATDGIDVKQSLPAGFTDVASKDWSYAYVNWGYQEGIVSGVGDNKFNPNAPITREQMTVMLCKYAVFQKYALPQKEGVSLDFVDSDKISSWALDYVYTVVGSKIMTGMGENRFEPKKIATRAQAAKIMYEYIDSREGIND